MSDILYGGIDPGANGYLVILDENGRIDYSCPLTNDFTEIDRAIGFAKRPFAFREGHYRMLIEEPLLTATRCGTKSLATQHQVFGVIFGSLMASGYNTIRVLHPSTWRAFYKFPKKKDKDIHYRKAWQLFPEYRVDIRDRGDGFVDALLIANYALKNWETTYNDAAGIHRQVSRRRRSAKRSRRNSARRRS